jgi:hypothetical protein
VERDTMALAAGLTLADERPRLAFSRKIDVLVWMVERVKATH